MAALTNGCFLVSACCGFLVIGLEDRFRTFLGVCRIYAVILSPVLLYYCMRFYLPSAEYGVNNLGAMGYMSLGYLLLDLCIFLTVDLLLFPPVNRKVLRLDRALFLLCCVSLTLTQCKGPMLLSLIHIFN